MVEGGSRKLIVKQSNYAVLTCLSQGHHRSKAMTNSKLYNSIQVVCCRLYTVGFSYPEILLLVVDLKGTYE